MHPTIRSLQKSQLQKVPVVKAGYTVRVSQKVKEGSKERIQNFEGLVIKIGHGEGVEKTFTVRKIVEGIGVEKVFPLHSTNLTKIMVKKEAKVRRSKLYYMRDRSGKSARMTERHITDEERANEEAMIQEAVDRQKKEDEAAAKAESGIPVEEMAEEMKEEVMSSAEMPDESAEMKDEADTEKSAAEEPATEKDIEDEKQG